MDHVYPLTFLDDSILNRLVVNWIIHFNDVLDAQKLKDAFTRLLHTGDYRKLGGRLRTKKDNRLEVHVPQQYTSTRPPFLYDHDNQGVPLAKHRLAPFLGEQSSIPCIQPYSTELSCFILGPGIPTSFQGWINADVPVMSIRITSFTDATLVGVSFPHCVMDGSGFQAMWQGWSLTLAAKVDSLPPVLASHEDLLSKAVQAHILDKHRRVSAMEQWRLRGWKLVAFFLRFVWRFMWNNHVSVRRIFITKIAIERLRARATQDLARTVHKGQFISENSVITAWFTRILALCEGKPTPVTLLSFFNTRYRLPHVQKDGVYLQNMILPWFTFIPRRLWGATVGEIALEMQTQARERTSQHEALSWLEMLHRAYYTGGNPILSMLAGESDAVAIGINNLDKFGFIQAINFGPAVVPQAIKVDTSRVNLPGTPERITILEKPERIGSFVYITGKDHGQNYSAIARMSAKEWVALEIELKELATRSSSKM